MQERKKEKKPRKKKLVGKNHPKQDAAQQCLIGGLLYPHTADGRMEIKQKGKKEGCNLTTKTKQRPFGSSLVLLNGPWCV